MRSRTSRPTDFSLTSGGSPELCTDASTAGRVAQVRREARGVDLYAAPPVSDAVVLAERRLDAVREALARVRVLLVEVDWQCGALPQRRCLTWLGDAAQAYELKLGELIGRAGLARTSLEQAERELAGCVDRFECELEQARAAERAAAAAVANGGAR